MMNYDVLTTIIEKARKLDKIMADMGAVPDIHCLFCLRHMKQAQKIVQGQLANICNYCVENAQMIMADEQPLHENGDGI